MSQFQLHVTYMQQLKQGMIDYMQNYDKGSIVTPLLLVSPVQTPGHLPRQIPG